MHDMDIVSALRAVLAQNIGRERFEVWFGPATKMTLAGGTLLVEAGSKFARDWLRQHYHGEIELACAATLPASVNLEFRMNESLALPKPLKHAHRGTATRHHDSEHASSAKQLAQTVGALRCRSLNCTANRPTAHTWPIQMPIANLRAVDRRGTIRFPVAVLPRLMRSWQAPPIVWPTLRPK